MTHTKGIEVIDYLASALTIPIGDEEAAGDPCRTDGPPLAGWTPGGGIPIRNIALAAGPWLAELVALDRDGPRYAGGGAPCWGTRGAPETSIKVK